MISTISEKILKLYKDANVALLNANEIDEEIKRLHLKNFNSYEALNHFILKIQANAYSRGYKQATDDLKFIYDEVEKENSSLIKRRN